MSRRRGFKDCSGSPFCWAHVILLVTAAMALSYWAFLEGSRKKRLRKRSGAYQVFFHSVLVVSFGWSVRSARSAQLCLLTSWRYLRLGAVPWGKLYHQLERLLGLWLQHSLRWQVLCNYSVVVFCYQCENVVGLAGWMMSLHAQGRLHQVERKYFLAPFGYLTRIEPNEVLALC